MKPPPPVRAELHPSRIAAAFVVITHAVTAVLIAGLAWRQPICAVLLFPVVASAAVARARARGRSAPCSLHVGLDRRITVTTLAGEERRGVVLADTYVGAMLTTVVWRPDAARFARTILLLPDTMAKDDFRRLRVMLRYGSEAGSMEAEAG